MNYLLICPGARAHVRMPGDCPLATVPLLGQTLLEYWLSHLAMAGTREVTILADTALAEIQVLVGGGQRWGLKATVQAEVRELTVAQATVKYSRQIATATTSNPVVLLDHFPGIPEKPLFETHAGFFATLEAWIPHANTADRVGTRELRPGIWVSHYANVSPQAELEAPCWIGRHARIGSNAIIGAGSIIEDGAVIDQAAEIRSSHVGAGTYVGKFGSIHESFAWGDVLLSWRTGSAVQVPDPFMMCALHAQRGPTVGMLGKLTELYARNKVDAELLWKNLLMDREG